jgi:hypothetical protein
MDFSPSLKFQPNRNNLTPRTAAQGEPDASEDDRFGRAKHGLELVYADAGAQVLRRAH